MTDAEYLKDLAISVDSRYGFDGDFDRIESIANRLKDMELQAKQYTLINNPKGYKIKYGKDHHDYMTAGELADKLITAADHCDSTDESLADVVDQEFLFGCWANELEMRNPDLIRDLRGLIIVLLREGA